MTFGRFVLGLLALLLVGCPHPTLRVAALPYVLASADRTPRTITVIEVHDGITTRPEGAYFRGDVTHWVEVEVLGADGTTTPQTWPYDAQDFGRLPPEPGTTLVVAPAEWLVAPGSLPRLQPRRP